MGISVKISIKCKKHSNCQLGYTFDTQGANADMAESAGYALTAITLSIVFIYIVLGSQFNSFIHPAAIMASLPLSLIGVFLALFLFR
ncbi:efflux RND transporter permease subunit, partial [Klebsiella pneumoniae]|uniref:efflux RND transporter permease subunit n=1 Tax=Klebsiella pneumoniae TaxID=573 RepID=UPI003A96DBEC